MPQSARSYTSMEMLRSPMFWLLYFMFLLVVGGGLMATAQLAPIARDFGVSNASDPARHRAALTLHCWSTA